MLNTASKNLNQRLKEFRNRAGLSQQVMGDRLGINQATYSAMELGKNAILHTYLPKLAEILNVQVWEFFADPKEIGAPEEEDREFFKMWSEFNKEDKGLIKQIARGISERMKLEAMCHHDLETNKKISDIDVSEKAS